MNFHPFFSGLKPTLHIAHRGGAHLAPENTLLAFEAAVHRWRTDMFELDVHRTRDGEFVVVHDPTVDRCTDGSGFIADMTLTEVQRLDAGAHFTPDGGRTFPFRGNGVRIPTFREVLRAFPKMRINVEIKPNMPSLAEAFAQLVREENSIARLCCGSEHDSVGERLAAILPEACHFYPREALAAFVLSVKMGEPAPVDARFHVLEMPVSFQGVRLIDHVLLTAARKAGKWVNVWTVDDAEEMRRLVAEGVGGIMTDRPDVLREVLDGTVPTHCPPSP